MAAVRGRDAAARAAAESGAHAHPSARHPPLRPAAAGGDHRRVGAAARVRVLRAGFRPCVRPDDAGGDAVSVYAVVSHRGAARELHRAQAHHAGLLVLDGRRGAGARRDGRAAGAQPDLPPRQRGLRRGGGAHRARAAADCASGTASVLAAALDLPAHARRIHLRPHPPPLRKEEPS